MVANQGGVQLDAELVLQQVLPYDEEEADALAWFQMAFFAGPLHVAKNSGFDEDVEIDAIKQEYWILMCAVCSPDRLGRRGSNIAVYNSEKDSDSWRLALMPVQADKKTKPFFARIFRTEDRLRKHQEVLRAMLLDSEWASFSEQAVWNAWQQLRVGNDLAEEWLEGRTAVQNKSTTQRLLPLVVKRIRMKPCREPGSMAGCCCQSLMSVVKA